MPVPYYSVCSPLDSLAARGMHSRRSEYELWRDCLDSAEPDPEYERDWTEHAAALAGLIGGTPNYIADCLFAMATLDKLPNLRELTETMAHLSMRHLRRIDSVINEAHQLLLLDPSFWETVDEELTTYLTPTKPNQLLPEPSAIARRLRSLFKILEHDLPPEIEEEEAQKMESYETFEQPNGSLMVVSCHEPATATAIDTAVRTYALAHEVSHAQALAELVLDRAKVTVTLNAYQACDIPDAPVFLQPFGMLDNTSAKRVLKAAARHRDIDAAADATSGSYQPSATIKAYVEGRDWVCRWPGCNRPASQSQKDHRVDYEARGPTAPSNLASLCQHHHNRKTDKVANYLIDPFSGDIYWLFDDHTWRVDEAEGPLAPAQKRWLRTLSQRRKPRVA